MYIMVTRPTKHMSPQTPGTQKAHGESCHNLCSIKRIFIKFIIYELQRIPQDFNNGLNLLSVFRFFFWCFVLGFFGFAFSTFCRRFPIVGRKINFVVVSPSFAGAQRRRHGKWNFYCLLY